MGYVLSGILETLVQTRSGRLQVCAAEALHSMMQTFRGNDIIMKFFPGIVSSLTKVLKSTGTTTSPSKVLVAGLHLLETTIMNAFEDPEPFNGTAVASTSSETHSKNQWRKANQEQVRMALVNVVKLRKMANHDVLHALRDLCFSLCRRCRISLQTVLPLSLETLIVLAEHGRATDQITVDELGNMLASDQELKDLLQNLTHDWMLTLPRIMQSTESALRAAGIAQIWTAQRVLRSLAVDREVLDQSFAAALVAGASAVMTGTEGTQIREVQAAGLSSPRQALSAIADGAKDLISLPSIGDNQSKVLEELGTTIKKYFSGRDFQGIRDILSEEINKTTGNTELAVLWLLSTCADQPVVQDANFNDVIDFPAEDLAEVEGQQVSEAAYSRALDILTLSDPGNTLDWRFEAMALRLVAQRSRAHGTYFRVDLVDVLYPVVERIGSPNALLREYAFVALDTIATSCGFEDAGHLIVQNADYLVNSIALKFNTFDITPQTPQVLTMMLELCGARLIPYLDDLLESIFSVLASFHGYPRLVDPLFQVLESIVKQSRPTNTGSTQDLATSHFKLKTEPISVKAVAVLIQEKIAGTRRRDESHSDEDLHRRDGDAGQEQSLTGGSPKDLGKVFTMVQSIVSLSQHYLANSAPAFRQRLLKLIEVGCSALCDNEDQFLPLINDIWPMVVKRLTDKEFFVCTAATKAMSEMFRGAGDFMATRVADEWHVIRTLCKKVQGQSEMGAMAMAGSKKFSAIHQTWEALVQMLICVIHHVRVDANIEDDMMDLLGSYATARPDVANALEAVNSDALWLRQAKQKGEVQRRLPHLNGQIFKEWPT